MILKRYRYRDAFFEAFFYLLTKFHLRTYIIILETWLSSNLMINKNGDLK